jgi:hypothetical protein
MTEKDLEMLGEVASALRTDSIIERIARLNREIGRGEAVYSAAELRRLRQKLEEYEALLAVLMHN